MILKLKRWVNKTIRFKPDELVDEGGAAGALHVLVLLAEDQLVDVRNQLDGLADDEQDGDGNLKRSNAF